MLFQKDHQFPSEDFKSSKQLWSVIGWLITKTVSVEVAWLFFVSVMRLKEKMWHHLSRCVCLLEAGFATAQKGRRLKPSVPWWEVSLLIALIKTAEAAQIYWKFWKYSLMSNPNPLRCWVLCLLQEWSRNFHPRRAYFGGIILLYDKSYFEGVSSPPGMNLYPGATLVLIQGMTLQHKSYYSSIFNSTFTKRQVDARLTSLEKNWQRFNWF